MLQHEYEQEKEHKREWREMEDEHQQVSRQLERLEQEAMHHMQ